MSGVSHTQYRPHDFPGYIEIVTTVDLTEVRSVIPVIPKMMRLHQLISLLFDEAESSVSTT
jgi:hypothetical protein